MMLHVIINMKSNEKIEFFKKIIFIEKLLFRKFKLFKLKLFVEFNLFNFEYKLKLCEI